MSTRAVSHLIITILLLATTSSLFAPVLADQNPLLGHINGRNITLTFEDLRTEHGFGKIDSYHHLDFSSFQLMNTTSAVAEGHIRHRDAKCATSGSNALVAHRARKPSLWPRMVLDPLAHVLPGEAPVFSLHGLSMKPMRQPAENAVCIFVSAYGLDAGNTIRAWHSLASCHGPKSNGGHLDISALFPGWGKAVNMVEFYGQAAMGDLDKTEWVDWPFCIDDIELERLDSGSWEWPEQTWPDIIPLLPPLAPFKFPDQGIGERKQDGYATLQMEESDRFKGWRADGMKTVFLSTELANI